MIKGWIASILIVTIVVPSLALAAVRGKEVMYVGGTVASLPEATEGELDTSDPKVLRFSSSKGNFEIPYEGVTSLEYGQKG